MKDKEFQLIKIEEKETDCRTWLPYLTAVLAMVALVLITAFFLNAAPAETPEQVLGEEDYLDLYVGPAEHPDRGEWMDPVNYYGVFDADGQAENAAGSLFSDGELKGVVPAGLLLEPVMLSYPDFAPFSYMGEYGCTDAYACASAPELVEIQLGVHGAAEVAGSYTLERNGCAYHGQAEASLTGLYYYIDNTFDIEMLKDGETTPEELAGAYGFLDPNFRMDYTGSFSASLNGEGTEGSLTGTFEGSMLTEGSWSCTANLSGQGTDVFPTGEVYLRCKLPCSVEKVLNGESSSFEDTVNLYFRIAEVRIGTRLDAIPDWAPEKGGAAGGESELLPEEQ